MAQAQEYLSTAGLVFRDPRAGSWQTPTVYLSGNLRAKLKEAEAAAVANPAFQSNITFLKQHLPRDLKSDEIVAPLGAGWIPEEYVQQFAQSIGLDAKIEYIPQLAKWIVTPTQRFKKKGRNSAANRKQWGTRYVAGIDLLEQALNGREPTVTRRGKPDLDESYEARDKQDKLKREFEKWLWSNKNRAERLTRLYNDRFNASIRPKFDGSYLNNIPGLNPTFTLRPHQKDALARLLQSRYNTYLVHLTGAGKTLVLNSACMELRRLGLRRKPVIVVPNHRPTDHARDFLDAYPSAKVLVVTSEDLSGDGYNQTLAKIANSTEYDAIIMSHSASERIGMRRDTEIEFIKEKIAEYDETIQRLPAGATKKLKLLTVARERQEKKLQKLIQAPVDDGRLTWEDLGIDHCMVDESHKYKNLEFATRKQGVAGINPVGSARAMGMYMKVRYLQGRCQECGKFVGEAQICSACGSRVEEPNPGNICFASATPLDNSLAEMYTWMRFLQPKRLKKLGLDHFDAWSAQFARPMHIIELAPFGEGYREAIRFASFVNPQELSKLFSEVADIQLDPEKLDLRLPKELPTRIVSAPKSERLQQYMLYCDERAAKVRARQISLKEDNFLRIASDLNAAALDFRLVDPTAPDDPNSKVNLLVRGVLDTYRKTTGVSLPGVPGKHNLAQVIFLDLSTPKKGFNLYDDIKTKLVRQGIPAEEIAFVHDAKNDEEKQRLFDRVSLGKVRVLLASSEIGGEGANFQARLCKLHHLDVPWTPRKLIQRRGRMVRQKNLCPEVESVVYVTGGSFDKYRWQTVERKAFTGDQVLKGDISDRTVDDIDVVHTDYATIKAMASGNPLVEQRVKLQLEIQRSQGLERVHQKQQDEARTNLDQILAEIALIDREAVKTPELLAERAELIKQSMEYRATLGEPFQYSQQLKDLQDELQKLEREIEISNRPQRKKSSLPVRLLRRIFGG
ncbi:MAG: hypothetical protein BroJett011_59570 [Chloroflexota bacterium]|nr:MAG: hypothetical protein BroJett011_59570 [Chloroflexota bacterium]